MNAVTQTTAVAELPKRSVLIEMASRYGMEAPAFEQTLRATVVPKDCSKEQFAAFLLVAREYNLNPVTKEIYAFPAKGGGIQPIVSIDGWCNLINSHPQCNGVEFDDHLSADGQSVDAITARIWRKDRDKPVVVTEYLAECKRATDPWKQYPRRMLRHKALIQCARYAFGFAGIVDPDEAARITPDRSPMRTVEHDDGPPEPPAARAIEHQASPPIDGQVVWDETGERPATAQDFAEQDDGSIPPALRREAKPSATAADVFDPAQWLRDLEGSFSGCEDYVTLGEQQKKLMLPQKGKAFPVDWEKAVKLFNANMGRIGTSVMGAG